MTGNSSAQKPQVLEKLDLPAIAKYMVSEQCKNVVLMLGAGVSTSAGIPDFRSPGTGLYANLARLNLPYPEAVFEINYFRRNPVPFYTLARELYPGRFRPTLAHAFIRVLAEHSLLHTCFTQNIDTLERRAGVPAEKIVEAHGSFATQRCIDCRLPYDGEKMRSKVRNREIARCERCHGLVKPDIVFFGESLPTEFGRAAMGLGTADLLIIMGTSLTVHPFASLVNFVPSECPRMLINLDRVGPIGCRTNDVVVQGKCDDIVRELCELLGWAEELQALWEETAGSVEVEAKADVPASEKAASAEAEEDTVRKVERLARQLEKMMVFDKDKTKPQVEEKTDGHTKEEPAGTNSKEKVSNIHGDEAAASEQTQVGKLEEPRKAEDNVEKEKSDSVEHGEVHAKQTDEEERPIKKL